MDTTIVNLLCHSNKNARGTSVAYRCTEMYVQASTVLG
jgi:hypothetical protein